MDEAVKAGTAEAAVEVGAEVAEAVAVSSLAAVVEAVAVSSSAAVVEAVAVSSSAAVVEAVAVSSSAAVVEAVAVSSLAAVVDSNSVVPVAVFHKAADSRRRSTVIFKDDNNFKDGNSFKAGQRTGEMDVRVNSNSAPTFAVRTRQRRVNSTEAITVNAMVSAVNNSNVASNSIVTNSIGIDSTVIATDLIGIALTAIDSALTADSSIAGVPIGSAMVIGSVAIGRAAASTTSPLR
jgi:hypothetical protein